MIELNNKNKRNVFSGVGIALLLCALMVLMSWSATVSNGDLAESSTVVNEDKSTDTLLTEDTNLEEEIDETVYDPEMEMLGMRTENSKTYITDSGTATVYTSEPQHMLNSNGQWVDIDYDVIVTESGYSLANAPVDVNFGLDVEDGFSVELSPEFSLDSGMNIALVDMNPTGISLSSVNGMAGKGTETYRINELYSYTTQEVNIGGNEIVYPITDEISVVYTATEGAVKQDIVVSEITQQLKQLLSANGDDGYFGVFETMKLPPGYYVSSEKVPLFNVDLFETSESLVIHNEMGTAVGTILKPVALEASEDKEGAPQSGITYFVTVDESGSSIEIITAVEKSWLLSDDTSFPVSIDPTVTYNQDQSAYECIVSSQQCVERTNGRATLRYDYYYEADEAPTFPFTFTQDTRPVERIDWQLYSYSASWTGYGDVVIMEQCGNSPLDSYNDNPRSIYNPSACTGTPLPPFTTGGANQEYIWTDVSSSTTSDAGSFTPACPTTICPSGEGIFQEGGYKIYWRDSYGDGPNGGTFDIQTREVDDGTGQPGAWSVSQSVTNTWTGSLYTLSTSVPAGFEMRVDYNCASWCSETSMGFEEAAVGPDLPPLTGTPPATNPACSPNCAPSGLESPMVTLSVPATDEAEMTWDCGSIGCDYNQVYYRSAGSLGWTDVWDMCGGSGADACNQLDTYYSSNDGIFFTFGNYEFLVWDTQADTAAEQFSNGGSGGIDLVPAGTYGAGGGDPVTARFNSLASSESVSYTHLRAHET